MKVQVLSSTLNRRNWSKPPMQIVEPHSTILVLNSSYEPLLHQLETSDHSTIQGQSELISKESLDSLIT